MVIAICSVTALLGLVGRSPPPRMGGFQQRPGSTAPLGQARVGLLVRGSATAVERSRTFVAARHRAMRRTFAA